MLRSLCGFQCFKAIKNAGSNDRVVDKEVLFETIRFKIAETSRVQTERNGFERKDARLLTFFR